MRSRLTLIVKRGRKHEAIPVSRQAVELLAELRRGPCSRLDLLRRCPRRPCLALSATSIVANLRRRGLAIDTEMISSEDGRGELVRFARYHLIDRVVRIEEKKKPAQRRAFN